MIQLETIKGDLPNDPFISYRPRSLSWTSANRTAIKPGVIPCASNEKGQGFVLLNQIARGGFGEVWEAHQASLGRVIAVKRIRKDLIEEGKLATDDIAAGEYSFQQEAMIAALLDHPNILPIYDLGLDEDGRSLLAMKLVRGKVWSEIVSKDFKELTELEFLGKHIPILIGLCNAVEFAHSRGIVHRDLKPSQVMVGSYGEVLLMDWGLAVIADACKASQDGSSVATSGVVSTTESAPNPAGTAAYMAPEQTEETAKRIGPWTDVYLLGSVLYQLLTGSAPHHSSTTLATLYKAAENQVALPSHFTGGKRMVPGYLEGLCMRALSTDPKDRPASAKEFSEGLEAYLTGASRMAESNELVELAREFADKSSCYDDLSRALVILERAGQLYPRNPKTKPLFQEVTLKFALKALENNDLQLARMNALQLEDEARREEILAQIGKAQNKASQARKQRRLIALVASLMIVSLIGFGLRYTLMQAKLHEAELQSLRQHYDALLVDTKIAQQNVE